MVSETSSSFTGTKEMMRDHPSVFWASMEMIDVHQEIRCCIKLIIIKSMAGLHLQVTWA